MQLLSLTEGTALQMGVYGYGGSNASSIWGVLARSLIPRGRKEQHKQQRDILNKQDTHLAPSSSIDKIDHAKNLYATQSAMKGRRVHSGQSRQRATT